MVSNSSDFLVYKNYFVDSANTIFDKVKKKDYILDSEDLELLTKISYVLKEMDLTVRPLVVVKFEIVCEKIYQAPNSNEIIGAVRNLYYKVKGFSGQSPISESGGFSRKIKMKINHSLVMIGDSQYLTDHHNRAGECLLYVPLPELGSKRDIYKDLKESVLYEIEAADSKLWDTTFSQKSIALVVEEISSNPGYLEEIHSFLTDSQGEDISECQIIFLLTW